MEKRQKERTEIYAKGKLCFGCYQPMTEKYNAKSCKQRLVCRLCFELPPNEMHDYTKKKTNIDHDNTQPREQIQSNVKLESEWKT